jgi:hypothetical protein
MAFNLQNAKDKFINALFGTPVQVEGVAPSVGYGDKIDEYLNGLGSQPYMQGLLNQPKETGLTLDQYKQGVANGLNYGVPEIAQAQKELGINVPKTGEEIELANVGQFNQPTMLSVGTAISPSRQGGFFNDLASGYRENATQGFDVNNLAPQRKGLATRIGEGLGTLARFYDKPIGRMAVATGLSMLTDEANPLGEGVKAYVGRQTNMTRDNVYRNQLKQMGMSEDEVNAIPGIITDDIFKNYTLANYRNNMTNYRNLKLDKDTYIKQQQNIYKMLNDGVITAEEATKQMQLLNDEYQKQNPMDMQESNKTVQGNRRLDIQEQQGNKRIDILQQNADTYAKKADKVKVEDTDEYRQDYTDYIRIMTDPKLAKYRSQAQVDFAAKYGKNPKVN